ncbi:hypothetical protein PDESU_04795 [Pontiella desulfatans]|uniref:Fatty acid desaturase domain-containing protein n=1 Tax=Pontiella desulfatans TaxID=2750659 RepID=A0A6C2U9Z1_PONDE|nr:fatty acid desaturase [Pontiella desulfatans]VGO16204.1 hypothetical protein PDESU_04795 [Pontiella desulfatans]
MTEQTRIKWYRTEVDKSEMKALMKRSDLPGFLQAGSQLAIVCATGWLCFHSFHHYPWWATLAAFFLHGSFISFLSPGAAIHELSHGTPFKTKAFNEFFFYLFSFITWTNPVWFRQSHIQHHQHTLHDQVDQEVVLPQHYSWVDVIAAFTLSPSGIFSKLKDTLLLAGGNLHTDWYKRLFDQSATKQKQLFNWARLILFGHIALTIAFLMLNQWILIPIVVLPFYCGWLTFLCGGTQHAGLQDNVADFRRSCRTVKMSAFNRFWYWNMNYHIEHHMYAAVPFHALPKLHKLIRHDLPAPSRSIAAAWKEIFKTTRVQKADLTYYFDNFTREK